MMRSGRLLLVAAGLAMAACWTSPPARTARSSPVDGPVAGTRWITPRQPWRASESVRAVAVRGSTALLGGDDGWLTELDLRSGTIVRERSIGRVRITDLLSLGDGRTLALGFEGDVAVGAIIDERTLEATPLALRGEPRELSLRGVHARHVPGEGVLIAGPGLPLAIYDPTTWEPTRFYSERPDWSAPFVTTDAVYATSGYATLRFPLHGGPLSTGQSVVAAAGSTVIVRRFAHTEVRFEAITASGAPVRLPPLGEAIALDPAGRRVATAHGRALSLYSLDDGRALRRIELGVPVGPFSKLVFAGTRIVVTDGPSVRVVDAVTGAVTPRGTAPLGGVSDLAVGDDGTVLALGREATTIVGGGITRSAPFEGFALDQPPGELARYAVLEREERGPTTITLRSRDRVERRWSIAAPVFEGWLGGNGEIAAVQEATAAGSRKLVRSLEGGIVDVVAVSDAVLVPDIDVDAGIVALSLGGTTHLVELASGERTGITLRAPRCAELAWVTLERGGPRASTSDEGELILWDRRRGTVLGTLALGRELEPPSFVRGREELIVPFRGGFALWSPLAREVRIARIPHLHHVAVSPGGAHLALSFASGQIALVDFAAMRATLPVRRARGVAKVPATCGDADPLAADATDHADDASADDHDEWGELDAVEDMLEEERLELEREASEGANEGANDP